jgi:hypothetical protein
MMISGFTFYQEQVRRVEDCFDGFAGVNEIAVGSLCFYLMSFDAPIGSCRSGVASPRNISIRIRGQPRTWRSSVPMRKTAFASNKSIGQFMCSRNRCRSGATTLTLCTIAEPVSALSEIWRVLRTGRNYVFLEHGRSTDLKVARLQDRLNPLPCERLPPRRTGPRGNAAHEDFTAGCGKP